MTHMMTNGIHQLLCPFLMSVKVLEGAVNVSTTRSICERDGVDSAAGCTLRSVIIVLGAGLPAGVHAYRISQDMTCPGPVQIALEVVHAFARDFTANERPG